MYLKIFLNYKYCIKIGHIKRFTDIWFRIFEHLTNVEKINTPWQTRTSALQGRTCGALVPHGKVNHVEHCPTWQGRSCGALSHMAR